MGILRTLTTCGSNDDPPRQFKDPARRPSADAAADGPARVQWSNKVEFLLSCISLSVGLGNVWRFPFMAYTFGGGAFLLPYIIVLLLVGRPMYFMEIVFGQFQSEGPVKVWKRSVPLGRGIGYAQVLINFCVSIFYIIVMVWTVYYFWVTLISWVSGEAVPWGTFCDSEYAHKPSCVPPGGDKAEDGIPMVAFNSDTTVVQRKSSADQYFSRYVTNQFKKGTSERYGLDNNGPVNLELLGCLAGCWALVFFSLIKGVKSSGKVVYITSTLPFVVLVILLIQSATLDNAIDGIKYLVTPQFNKLLDIQTWKGAAEQMFFSLNVGFGALTMMGSYNSFQHNCYRDSMIVSVVDSATSVVSALAMFSVLGFLAGELEVGIDNVVSSGPGLAFVTFPEATSRMPLPHLWAILFFIMLFTLGLGSEIGAMESVLSFICDRFPELRTKRPIVAAVAVTISFLLGIPFITQGGLDLFTIFNDYAGTMSILFISTFEMILIMWIYGLKRFSNNIEEMLGKNGKIGYYFRSTWLVSGPLMLLFILFLTIIQYKTTSEKEGLPGYADTIGWLIASAAIIMIPIFVILEIYKAEGTGFMEKLSESLWPAVIMSVPTKSLELTSVVTAELSIDIEKPPAKIGITNLAYNAANDQ